MGTVVAICAGGRGSPKRRIGQANIAWDFGVSGDGHAGKDGLQVSLLPLSRVRELQRGADELEFGLYGENIVFDGIDASELTVGAKLASMDVVLEVCQVGKESLTGDNGDECVMHTAGIFCKVRSGGILTEGDSLLVE